MTQQQTPAHCMLAWQIGKIAVLRRWVQPLPHSPIRPHSCATIAMAEAPPCALAPPVHQRAAATISGSTRTLARRCAAPPMPRSNRVNQFSGELLHLSFGRHASAACKASAARLRAALLMCHQVKIGHASSGRNPTTCTACPGIPLYMASAECVGASRLPPMRGRLCVAALSSCPPGQTPGACRPILRVLAPAHRHLCTTLRCTCGSNARCGTGYERGLACMCSRTLSFEPRACASGPDA